MNVLATGAGSEPSAGPARRLTHRDGWRGLGLVAPAALWTVFFFLLPSGLIALWSLYRREGATLVTEPSLDNYRRLLEVPSLRLAAWNSLEVAAVVTVLSVALAYPLAWVIANRVAPARRRVWLMLAVLPFWTSYVVRSYAWLLVLSPEGWVNQASIALGVLSEPVPLAFSFGATVTGFVHFFVMLCTLTIYASLVRIDPRLRLAAADLGASGWQTFLRVTLPLSLPGVAAGAFLTFVVCIGDYVTPQILGGNTRLLLPQVILLQINRRADLPMAAALSVVLLALVTVAYLALARWLTARRP